MTVENPIARGRQNRGQAVLEVSRKWLLIIRLGGRGVQTPSPKNCEPPQRFDEVHLCPRVVACGPFKVVFGGYLQSSVFSGHTVNFSKNSETGFMFSDLENDFEYHFWGNLVAILMCLSLF